jgi:hypothetical protein
VRFLKNKTCKKSTLALKGGGGGETQKAINFGDKMSGLSFFLSASTAATYIFTAPNCTTTITSLEPRAVTAEFQQFTLSCKLQQHFIPRFDKKMSLLCSYH